MAKFVLTDVKTTINGTDFSDHLASVAISITSNEVEDRKSTRLNSSH